ncbi:hypothetical protein ACQBAU_16260 [Propionibacteriaceae bacterium Y2011]
MEVPSMHELPAGEAVSGTVLDDDQSVEAATKASIKAAKLGTIDLGAARTLEGLAKDVDSILTTGLNRVGKFGLGRRSRGSSHRRCVS